MSIIKQQFVVFAAFPEQHVALFGCEALKWIAPPTEDELYVLNNIKRKKTIRKNPIHEDEFITNNLKWHTVVSALKLAVFMNADDSI